MNQEVKILVVENETMIAEDIVLRLLELRYSITGCVSSVNQAIEILDKQETDLVLIDINLDGNKNGIELAQYINKYIQIPFIFLTSLANQSTLQQAKEVSPSAYLLKPFNDRQIQFSIEIALNNFGKNKDYVKTAHLKSSSTKDQEVLQLSNCLFLKKDFQFKRVEFKDIYWLEAESNYTMIHTKKGNFMYSTVLKNFEDKLPVDQFYRVHRSFIVNIENITGFEGNILFINEKRIPVSKVCRDLVFSKFKVM